MGSIRVFPELQDFPWHASLCFTGHRPERLPRGDMLEGLKTALYYYIHRAVDLGFTCFYTGMADGVDYYAAHHLFRLREKRPDICVIGIQPCRDYELFFRLRGYSLPHLYEMQDQVDKHIILPGSYGKNGTFLYRNRVMAEHCSGIIAVCDNSRSGSMYTFSYAKELGLSYCRLYPKTPDGSIPRPEQWPSELYGFTP